MKRAMISFLGLHSYFLAFAIVLLLAAGASAQHVKVFDGRSGALLATSGTVSLTAFAGQTIRLRIAATNNRSGANDDFKSRSRAGSLVQETVSCSAAASVPTTSSSGLSGGKVSWSYSLAHSEHNYLVATDRSWKGTCRIFTVQLSNGNEYRARVRFR